MKTISDLLGITQENHLKTLIGGNSGLEDIIKPGVLIDSRIFDTEKKPNIIDRIKSLKKRIKK